MKFPLASTTDSLRKIDVPSFGQTLSKETEEALARVDENIKHAMIRAQDIFLG